MKKKYLLLIVFIALYHNCFCQTITRYSVYKLENRIGREESSEDPSGGVHINITTNDRGTAMTLAASFSVDKGNVRYTSAGNTSRFTTESIDTSFSQDKGFPMSKNGSIKTRELLIADWNKAGRPDFIPSVLNGQPISISVIGKEKDPLTNGELAIIKINTDLDEILWVDEKGNAVYLSICDAEGDKREVINDAYLPFFKVFNHTSNQYLIKTYADGNKNLGQSYAVIAVLGGNIIDVADSGKISYNTLVLLKNGKIAYIGKADKALIPAGATIIDATDKFLIPGLWNMHVHLFHPEYLKRELLTGVTTVRDMANEFDFITNLKKVADDVSFPAPRILNAGVLDGKSPYGLGVIRATNEQEIKANVKMYHDAGFNQIKIYSYIKKNDFDAIVKEARLYDMDVVGHLPVGYTVGYFIDNGIQSISHIHYFMNNIKWDGDLKATNKPLLDKLIEKKIYLDPTLNIYNLTGDKKIPLYNKLVKLFFDYGVPIVAGTDNEGTIPDEIQSYVKLGLSPLDALRSATIVPATMMKLDAQSGSIATGKNADLLILNSNPLINMDALDNIAVIIKGQLVINKNADK
ncbi:Imidazolonepropionase [Mucilaginibacter pineti]|uniref:Imidazolonepropionase n=1 Tax=Mucilaginibacter pineti TaxID=1391627 RepID=A0A1G7FWG4_9SPHI|nr:amidohydrolase family protein [Mucilaginibacter pineti]SDE80219.1 Imidazolonepropionase [Mucilaginibacter pineti]